MLADIFFFLKSKDSGPKTNGIKKRRTLLITLNIAPQTISNSIKAKPAAFKTKKVYICKTDYQSNEILLKNI